MKQIDIFLIDDEKKFVAMLAKRIELRGYNSEICYDGRTALQWIKKNSFCVTLILLDLQLPDLYGTKVLTEIKKINPAIPVVILTGHGTEQDRKECEQLGAYMFMHKPPHIDEIITIIKRIKEQGVA